jgi:Flp pilus assembly protein TadG
MVIHRHSPRHVVSTLRSSRRRGASAVELAVVAPVFFVLVFGLIEFSRMVMCYQVLTSAAREAARVGAVPGTNSGDVTDRGNDVLAAGAVAGATISVVPAEVAGLDQGQTFTVTAQGNFGALGWLPVPQWLGGRVLQSSVTMTREGR